MNTYKVNLLDKDTGARRSMDVQAATCLEAVNAAKAWSGRRFGFVESAYLTKAA